MLDLRSSMQGGHIQYRLAMQKHLLLLLNTQTQNTAKISKYFISQVIPTLKSNKCQASTDIITAKILMLLEALSHVLQGNCLLHDLSKSHHEYNKKVTSKINAKNSATWDWQSTHHSLRTFVRTSKSCDTKTTPNIKNLDRLNLDIVP